MPGGHVAEENEPQNPELEALRTQLAARDADVRRLQLTGILKGLGAPATFADIYTGDLDEAKVKTFVSSLQIPAPEPSQSQESQPADTSAWGRYEGTQSVSAPAGSEPSDVDKLLERGRAAIEKSKPSMNPFQVGEADILDQKQFAADVNRMHREWERMVRRRQMQPAYRGLEGFGGRMDPPDYAYVAQDRELIGS